MFETIMSNSLAGTVCRIMFSTTYRGWTIYELPPNGQGMASLEMLNIMETSPPSPDGPLSVAELHKKIEAMKLAYADLERYNADPRFAKVPVKGLLSKEYAKKRANLIDSSKANCAVAYGAPASDTTYLSVVDREGNIVSLIQSNYDAFGSGITVRGMGFVLQDRGALFSLLPRVDDRKSDAGRSGVVLARLPGDCGRQLWNGHRRRSQERSGRVARCL